MFAGHPAELIVTSENTAKGQVSGLCFDPSTSMFAGHPAELIVTSENTAKGQVSGLCFDPSTSITAGWGGQLTVTNPVKKGVPTEKLVLAGGGGNGIVTFSGTVSGTGSNGSLFGNDQLSGSGSDQNIYVLSLKSSGSVFGNDFDPILAKYQSLGGAGGILGKPTSGEQATTYGGGIYERFQNGAIYWSLGTGAHDIYGPVATEYDVTAGETDSNGVVVQQVLGLPIGDEAPLSGVPGATSASFQAGFIDWSQATKAHVVYGAIKDEYTFTAQEGDANGHNVQKDLGLPTGDEANVPGVPGARMSTFQGGTIYWSLGTHAHVVYGGIGVEYNVLGGAKSYGLPTSDEAFIPDGQLIPAVRVTTFEGGRAILWTATAGAHAVYGAILQEYYATAGETDANGLNVQALLVGPTSDEMNVPGVPGARMNTFQGGTIYWSPATGAHVVYGAIGALYQNMGGPTSYLGLPTSDEEPAPAGGRPDYRVSYFQNGKIWWTPEDGAHAVQAVSEIDADANGLVSFGGGNPVNARANLTVYPNGWYHYWGNFNNYGFFLSYNDTMVLALVGTSGAAIDTFVHQGHVGPQQVDSWDEWGYSPILAADWADLEGGPPVPPQHDLAWDPGPLVMTIISAVAQVEGWWISTVNTITQNS
jgi:uncharacterized protein with LGFP repeats